MLIQRKKCKIDNTGFDKKSEKVSHISRPGFKSEGVSNTYSSEHSYLGGSKKGKEIEKNIEHSMNRMEKEMEDIWKF